MRFSLLLLILAGKLRKASRKSDLFRTYISTLKVRILIKTANGRRGRLFIFDRGTVSSVSLIWVLRG